MTVIADTGLINYLILIEEIEVLPALYGRVVIPQTYARHSAAHERPNPYEHGSPGLLHGLRFSRQHGFPMGI